MIFELAKAFGSPSPVAYSQFNSLYPISPASVLRRL